MDPIRNNKDNVYEIFLSYRHKPRDNKICKKAHTFLESFKPPRRHKQADIKRVFRDDDELPVAGVLSDTIGKALNSARILLVICSLDTPQSQWVDREVRTFIDLGRADRIFALLIEGDPEKSFPPSLRIVPGIENRTLRIQARSVRQSMKKLKKELLKVISAATNTPFDPLRIAIRRRKLRRSILAAIALSSFLFVSGFYSLYHWSKASFYSLVVQRNELVIHEVINDITFDLTRAVESMPGASSALVEILSNNIDYLDQTMGISGSSEESLIDKGNNYLSLARAYMLRGENNKAIKTSTMAVELFENLARESANSTRSQKLAMCYNLTGLYMQSMNEYDEAVDYLESAVAVYQELDKIEPNKDYPSNQADCLNNIAVCYYLKGDYKVAANAFIQEIALRKNFQDKELSLDDQGKLADLTASVGSCLISAQDYKGAKSYNSQAVALYKSFYEESLDAQSHKSYVTSLYFLSTNLLFINRDEEAEYNLRLCLVEADKLIRELPEFDPTYLGMYAMYDLLYAGDTKTKEAFSLAGQAYKANPSDVFICHVYSYSLLFNDQYEDALEELSALIKNNSSTPKNIQEDLRLFEIRGRATEDLLRLKDHWNKGTDNLSH